MNSRIRTPFYILFLNPVYVAARSLRSLRSNYLHRGQSPACLRSWTQLNFAGKPAVNAWNRSFVGDKCSHLLQRGRSAAAYENQALVFFMPYNKSFIDQASSVKMVTYWPLPPAWVSCHFDLALGQKRSERNRLTKFVWLNQISQQKLALPYFQFGYRLRLLKTFSLDHAVKTVKCVRLSHLTKIVLLRSRTTAPLKFGNA